VLFVKTLSRAWFCVLDFLPTNCNGKQVFQNYFVYAKVVSFLIKSISPFSKCWSHRRIVLCLKRIVKMMNTMHLQLFHFFNWILLMIWILNLLATNLILKLNFCRVIVLILQSKEIWFNLRFLVSSLHITHLCHLLHWIPMIVRITILLAIDLFISYNLSCGIISVIQSLGICFCLQFYFRNIHGDWRWQSSFL
jgi:hypothetical protein